MSDQIQGLSKVCRDPVQFKGSWTEIGLENPGIVHLLSNNKLSGEADFLPWTMSGKTLDLDKHWTWTNCGQV